jgi:ribosome-binding protein aMBF1 (putative translation factor)
MKVCEICGEEISTRDGENVCLSCEDAQDSKQKQKLARARANRKANDAVLRSLGLVKVRGALGGTYWE